MLCFRMGPKPTKCPRTQSRPDSQSEPRFRPSPLTTRRRSVLHGIKSAHQLSLIVVFRFGLPIASTTPAATAEKPVERKTSVPDSGKHPISLNSNGKLLERAKRFGLPVVSSVFAVILWFWLFSGRRRKCKRPYQQAEDCTSRVCRGRRREKETDDPLRQMICESCSLFVIDLWIHLVWVGWTIKS